MTEQIKKCACCGKIKPLTEFYPQKGAKDGHMGWCKKCHNKRCYDNYKSRRVRKLKAEMDCRGDKSPRNDSRKVDCRASLAMTGKNGTDGVKTPARDNGVVCIGLRATVLGSPKKGEPKYQLTIYGTDTQTRIYDSRAAFLRELEQRI